MALSAAYLRKPQDVMAQTKDGAVGRIPEKATGCHSSDKRWRCRQDTWESHRTSRLTQKMALSAEYLRKPQDVTALTKYGTVGRIPEKATGRHDSD
jgi:hypothetical protein